MTPFFLLLVSIFAAEKFPRPSHHDPIALLVVLLISAVYSAAVGIPYPAGHGSVDVLTGAASVPLFQELFGNTVLPLQLPFTVLADPAATDTLRPHW
ncbi:hypothetical protein D3C81_1690670 [compost metagenome]